MHPVALGEGKRLANKASKPLAQGVNEAFHVAGLARTLAAQAMRASRKHFCVGQPEVAAGGPAAVHGWNALAQRTGTFCGTIPSSQLSRGC